VTRIVVAHLYPDYLNIYADRGNIAVLSRRAALRAHGLDVRAVSMGDRLPPEASLLYVGGGQDREQGLVALDIAARGEELRDAAAAGVAGLAVCGGYQLLGRSYRDTAGKELPGAGILPLHTVAGERRMIGDVLLDCDVGDGERLPLAGFEGCRAGRIVGTYLHGPLLPRNPWLADRLLELALAHATGEEVRLAPLDDALEREAQAVSAGRARERGGRA
jgi:CobQ-like glutamine amidotransferase family enzyme